MRIVRHIHQLLRRAVLRIREYIGIHCKQKSTMAMLSMFVALNLCVGFHFSSTVHLL